MTIAGQALCQKVIAITVRAVFKEWPHLVNGLLSLFVICKGFMSSVIDLCLPIVIPGLRQEVIL